MTTTTGRCSPRKATEMDAKQIVFNLGFNGLVAFESSQISFTSLFADTNLLKLHVSAWQLADDLLSTGTKIMQSLKGILNGVESQPFDC